MFDLHRDVPADPRAVVSAVEACVRRRLDFPDDRPRVTVGADAFEVDLTGGHVGVDDPTTPPPPAPRIVGDRRTVFRGLRLRIFGSPLGVGPSDVVLDLSADHVDFDLGRGADGRDVLAPSRASDGRLRVSATQDAVLRLTRETAAVAAAGYGVTLDRLDADVQVVADRRVTVRGGVGGHKRLGFLNPGFGANFDVTAELDDDLRAWLRRLEVQGQGTVTQAALTLLRPKLSAMQNRPIDLKDRLAGFLPDAMRVTDVRLASSPTGELSMHAGFVIGSPA